MTTEQGDLLLLDGWDIHYPDGLGEDGAPEYAVEVVGLPWTEEVDSTDWFGAPGPVSLRDDVCPVEEGGFIYEYARRLAHTVRDGAVIACDGTVVDFEADGAAYRLVSYAPTGWHPENWEYALADSHFMIVAQE